MKEAFAVIEQMKHEGVIQEYAVAGAVGAIFYTEPFSTEDVDILLNLQPAGSLLVSLEPIFSYLQNKGFKTETGGGVDIGGWSVQFLPVSDDLTFEALSEAQYLAFDHDLSVRVLRPEHLAAEALKIGRPKDLQRIALLLESEQFDRARFRQIIQRNGLKERWKRVQQVIHPPDDGT